MTALPSWSPLHSAIRRPQDRGIAVPKAEAPEGGFGFLRRFLFCFCAMGESGEENRAVSPVALRVYLYRHGAQDLRGVHEPQFPRLTLEL